MLLPWELLLSLAAAILVSWETPNPSSLFSSIVSGILLQTEYKRPFLALLLSLGCWLVLVLPFENDFAIKALVDSNDNVGAPVVEEI